MLDESPEARLKRFTNFLTTYNIPVANLFCIAVSSNLSLKNLESLRRILHTFMSQFKLTENQYLSTQGYLVGIDTLINLKKGIPLSEDDKYIFEHIKQEAIRNSEIAEPILSAVFSSTAELMTEYKAALVTTGYMFLARAAVKVVEEEKKDQ